MKFPLKHRKSGAEIYNDTKGKINNVIETFAEDGLLNAELITANWFPEIEADIFISHSRKDSDSVLSLAGWLYDTFGIISFIDSCVWGYSNKLLKLIDKEYCYNSHTGLYDYNMRNLSTSHVYMMLSVALSKMIYNTEALFFYNTQNSVTPNDIIDDDSDKTLSPWIYSELAMTNLVERRTPEKHRRLIKSMTEGREDFSGPELKVAYTIDISNLPVLNASYFINWSKIGFLNNKNAALDYLYQPVQRRRI
ncbi:MAG: hypothetical protein LBU51_01325 [Bacteroidales bacterium]|nr:hypothetical protein [Bacteroidales bacterium]